MRQAPRPGGPRDDPVGTGVDRCGLVWTGYGRLHKGIHSGCMHAQLHPCVRRTSTRASTAAGDPESSIRMYLPLPPLWSMHTIRMYLPLPPLWSMHAPTILGNANPNHTGQRLLRHLVALVSVWSKYWSTNPSLGGHAPCVLLWSNPRSTVLNRNRSTHTPKPPH